MADGPQSLIGPGDPEPFERIDRLGQAPLLIICDHASNAIPGAMNGLGLSDEDLNLHIAHDIGAAAIARRLAAQMDASLVLAGYSRLLIDANRHTGEPGSIPEVSSGVIIPGNQGLSAAQHRARAANFFWPYHHAISDGLKPLYLHCPAPAVFSVHTFTPHMPGEDRPWHMGVLWNRDARMAAPLLDALARLAPDLNVGDNLPYAGPEVAYSLNLNAGLAGLPHVAVEIRQDLAGPDEAEKWADLLAAALAEILAIPGLHALQYY
jgi:predicted N-formylglutamate amidohydrolase